MVAASTVECDGVAGEIDADGLDGGPGDRDHLPAGLAGGETLIGDEPVEGSGPVQVGAAHLCRGPAVAGRTGVSAARLRYFPHAIAPAVVDMGVPAPYRKVVVGSEFEGNVVRALAPTRVNLDVRLAGILREQPLVFNPWFEDSSWRCRSRVSSVSCWVVERFLSIGSTSSEGGRFDSHTIKMRGN